MRCWGSAWRSYEPGPRPEELLRSISLLGGERLRSISPSAERSSGSLVVTPTQGHDDRREGSAPALAGRDGKGARTCANPKTLQR